MFNSGSRKREENGRVRERERKRGEGKGRAITIVCSQDECVDAPETKHIQEVP